MELANYFLADLPDSATLSPRLITEACQTLNENREKFLLTRGTDSLILILAKLALDWLDPEYPFRQMVLEQGPEKAGFSRQTIEAGLNSFFSEITRENLERLVIQDLGSVRRLDEIVSDPVEVKEDRASTARGHDLLVHVTGGVLPNPTLTSIMLGLLVRSAQFIKCGTGTSFIPRMFAHSLYATQPKLASCIEIAEWKGGSKAVEDALFSEAACVTATGSDATLSEIRGRLPARVRFLGYGHKLSFGYIARESLVKIAMPKVVAAAAEDVSAWDQLGCLSPHLIYVETGGAVSPQSFAEALANELANHEQQRPRGVLKPESAATLSTRRMFYEVRAANHESTKIWSSEGSTAWTVVYEDDPQFQLSCLNRFILVKPITDVGQLKHAIANLHGSISTVGLGAPVHRAQEIALELARAGVPRVCPLGKMQKPPLTWRHDGRPALGDLVTWTDLEL
jgi:hypothetical protein